LPGTRWPGLLDRADGGEVGVQAAGLRRGGQAVQPGGGQLVEQLARHQVAGVGGQRGGKQHLVGDALSGPDDVHRPHPSDGEMASSGRRASGNVDVMKRAGLTTTPESVPAR
jgi:hypothetical protein